MRNKTRDPLTRDPLRDPRGLRGLMLLPSIAWGALLLHYWRSGSLNLLIHPAYHGLTIATGITLLILSVGSLLSLFKPAANRLNHSSPLFQRLGSVLLMGVAIVAFLIPPQISASALSTDRPVTDFLGLSRIQPKAFRANLKSEDRTIVDWVRTLNVYPEPDAYQGDAVQVEGFVLHPPELPENYLLVARFVITCCAADMYPVGLPVALGGNRSQYPVDSWIRIQGSMTTDTVQGQRKAVIKPKTIAPIAQPKNPYVQS